MVDKIMAARTCGVNWTRAGTRAIRAPPATSGSGLGARMVAEYVRACVRVCNVNMLQI